MRMSKIPRGKSLPGHHPGGGRPGTARAAGAAGQAARRDPAPRSLHFSKDFKLDFGPVNRVEVNMKLSILMPASNEAATVGLAIKRVLDVRYPCEIELVAVDDGSKDNTREVLAGIDDPRLVIGEHPVNRGKGAAVRTAAAMATGDHMIVFDADLEYYPEDILNLLAPLQRGDAEVVYGVRTFGASTAHSFWFVIGNKVNTFTANAVFNTWISDLHTCLKLMPLDLFRQLPVRENGFGLDTEITALLLARGYRPYEVPINYKARSREEGKKLTWGDGVESTWILFRVRVREGLRKRRARQHAARGPA